MYARICNVDMHTPLRRGRGNKNDNSVVPPLHEIPGLSDTPQSFESDLPGLDGQMPAHDPRQRRVPALSAGAMSRRFEGINHVHLRCIPYKYGVWREGWHIPKQRIHNRSRY